MPHTAAGTLVYTGTWCIYYRARQIFTNIEYIDEKKNFINVLTMFRVCYIFIGLNKFDIANINDMSGKYYECKYKIG